MDPTLEDRGDDPTASGFDAVWARADAVPGWLTREQARALYAGVRRAPSGATVVEIGSHQGRSTLVLAGARPDVIVIAIDPHRSGGKFGGPQTAHRFRLHLTAAGVEDRVRHLPLSSAEAYAAWEGPIDLLYIDGKHDFWSVRQDLRWVSHVAAQGEVFVHDVHGSLGVTTALLMDLVRAHTIAYVQRWGSLARFTPGPGSPAQRRALLSGLPWFARNLGLKALLRLRLTSVTRRLGHEGRADPF